MARVNVEDSLFERRFWFQLLIKMQDEDKALGCLIRAYRVAQRYWYPDKRPIPKNVWKEENLNPLLIESGAAVEIDDGIYIKGSEDAFAWLFAKQKAGQKSGEARRKKKEETQSNSDEQCSTVLSGDEQNEQTGTSYSYSSSISSSNSNSSKGSTAGQQKKLPLDEKPVESPVGFFIAAYVRAYQARYGPKARPDLRGKVQGQIKRFLGDVPIERACLLIETYCEMDTQWFVTKGHDFGTFIENLNPVGLKLDTGTSVSKKQAAEAERKSASRSAAQEYWLEKKQGGAK